MTVTDDHDLAAGKIARLLLAFLGPEQAEQFALASPALGPPAWVPCCPFCERPGPPCRGDAKTECEQRQRGMCPCRERLPEGAAVVTPYGPGTITESHDRWHTDQALRVEIPRAAWDGAVPDLRPWSMSMHPTDAWLAGHPGPQHCYVWYRVQDLHLAGCWKLGPVTPAAPGTPVHRPTPADDPDQAGWISARGGKWHRATVPEPTFTRDEQAGCGMVFRPLNVTWHGERPPATAARLCRRPGCA